MLLLLFGALARRNSPQPPPHLADAPPPSRPQEQEKMKALRKSIEASKKHLEQLEKDHAELEKSIKKE